MSEAFHDRSDDARETAAYIASLARELAEMAEAGKMPVLRYLLEMARHEADVIAGRRKADDSDR